jgi:hypothetical protein
LFNNQHLSNILYNCSKAANCTTVFPSSAHCFGAIKYVRIAGIRIEANKSVPIAPDIDDDV